MWRRRIYWIVVVCCSNISLGYGGELRDCTPGDYHYEYTPCDEAGKRWRVAVPHHEVCTPTVSSFNSIDRVPVNGTNCKKECDSGLYLDLDTQTCKKCLAGTYSTGSTTKYDDWSELPPGFSANTEGFQSYGDDLAEINCTNNAWTPKGSYISVTPGYCAGNLVLSVSLLKAGSLNFEYQYPSSGSLFHVTVQNDQCQAAGDKDSSLWPGVTEGGSWTAKRMNLKSGFNVITWRVIGLQSGDLQPVLLRKVGVTGVAYSSNCAGCAAGMFSSDGASECTDCPVNTFSAKAASYCTPCVAYSSNCAGCAAGTFSSDGASECTDCPVNTFSAKAASYCTPCNDKTQYAAGGATECSPRPPCKDTDFYHMLQPCNAEEKTRTVYQWIQPIICFVNDPKSIKLPASSDFFDCHTCNPGMHSVNKSCTFCPRDHMSDGTQCVKCGPSTSADYGLWYQNWNGLPQGVQTSCISFVDTDCNNDTQWLPYGDHLSSHFARGESAYLVVQVKVPGFRTAQKAGDGSSVTIGQFSVTFETACSTFCQLVLLSDESGAQDIVATWEFTQAKTKYTHDVKKNGSFTFTLAFQNSGWLYDPIEVRNNTAKIYAIEVTNTIEGGAQQCMRCPKGSDQGGCIPCPDGHYIDNSTVTCVKCPAGTVVYSHKAIGADSCRTCGQGLQVYQGRVCMSDGLFTNDQGKTYDLRNLTGSQYIQGSLLFTTSGTQYYHGFNISLFGNPETSQVSCTNNVTKSPDNAMKEPKSVSAKICRSTLVPALGNSNDVMATQATSLGDHLTAIIHNETALDLKNGTQSTIRNLYLASGFDIQDIENDIQVHFLAESPTKACPSGRKAVVSLRCDADQKDGGEILLPPKCSDGTCDGCTFHFMWRVRDACPVCSEEDFKEVIGECVQGSQIIHYLPPQHCIIKKTVEQKTRTCTVNLRALPFFIQILIPVFLGVGVIMFCLICFFWRKNKKLEYRYMQLQEHQIGGDEEELPGVESCAVEEGDFDEQGDAVQIRDSKGARFFKKLTNKIKGDDAFDSTLMNERMPLT